MIDGEAGEGEEEEDGEEEEEDVDDANADQGGDPTDGAVASSDCVKNWKAAASDEKKRTWAIFDETGIYASACRHGLILWICDMVRSGELCVCQYFREASYLPLM